MIAHRFHRISACLLSLSASASAADVVFEPAITGETQAPPYVLWDGGSGPSQSWSNQQLGVPWVHPVTGDFVDAAGVAQGPTPFASATAAAGAYAVLDTTVLVTRALANGNKGTYLKATGSMGPSLVCSGRSSAHPPTLSVTTAGGIIACPCIQSAGWSSSSSAAGDTRAQVSIDDTGNFAVLRFDLSGVSGAVTAATLSVYVESSYGSGTALTVFEADPPRFALGAGAGTPTLGLAAEVGEAALAANPDVYMAGDFAGTTFSGDVATIPKLFGATQAPAVNSPQIIPDPDSPGTVAWRGSFTANAGDTRQSFNGTKLLMVADMNDPLRPPLNVVDEAYYRLYFMLEDDWNSERDGNKMAITWDLRMGWWNDVGYWQSVSGNGGAPGTGHRAVEAIAALGGAQRYVYDGHMERMESGFAPGDGSPYSNLRPFVGYNYHIDQGSAFPPGIIYSNLAQTKFRKGRWVCVEQHLKMNSIDLSHPDAEGNGVPRYDGILETWVDGVKIDGRYDYRWRCHPQMGIAAVNSNWFYGGTQPTEVTMHYRLNHLVVAKRYIGPRVASTMGTSTGNGGTTTTGGTTTGGTSPSGGTVTGGAGSGSRCGFGGALGTVLGSLMLLRLRQRPRGRAVMDRVEQLRSDELP
jgi:hypothetical protein